MEYHVDKFSCYVSDDGSAMLKFESLSETTGFAKKWVPFCKKHSIESRAPEFYFDQKIDYLKDKIQPYLVKERRAMKVSFTTFMFLCFIPRFFQIPKIPFYGRENTKNLKFE